MILDLRLWRKLRRPTLAIAVLASATQLMSALFRADSFESPNAADEIGAILAESGRFEGGSWARLAGPEAAATKPPLRMFHLPGEPLVVAMGLRALPTSLQRFLHVPVTVILITAVAFAAGVIGGGRLVWWCGAVGILNPFVLVHGPVWDDVFLAAALGWVVLILGWTWSLSVVRRSWVLAAIGSFAAFAALTRGESQFGLIAVALVLGLPAATGFRRPALAILLGVVLALLAWGGRNHAVSGQFRVGTTHDGITLWEANGPYTRQAIPMGQVEALSSDPALMNEHWAAVRDAGEIEADAYYRAEAIRHNLDSPGSAIRTGALKVAISLLGFAPQRPVASLQNVVRVGSSLFYIIVGLLGLTVLLRSVDDRRRALLLGTVVALSAVNLLFLAVGPIGLRYRLVLETLLWIGVAASGSAIWVRTKKMMRRVAVEEAL